MNSLSYFVIYIATFGLVVNFAAAQTVYIVGDNTGWIIPTNTSFYSEWASGKTFVVGDTLEFNFTTGRHDVVQVPKASYDNCTDANAIGDRITSGPVNVTLGSAGDRYYICSFSTHCVSGQKLSITVAASSTPGGGATPPPPMAVPPPPTTTTTPPPATPPPPTTTSTTTPPPATPRPTTPTAASPPPITPTTPSPAIPPSSSSVSLGGSFLIITICAALALII